MAHAHPDSVPACVFFSYPLHPPRRTDQLRDDPLTALQAPLLFVRGTNDAFCEEAQYQQILKRLTSPDVQVRCCLLAAISQYRAVLLDLHSCSFWRARCMRWRVEIIP